MKKTIRNKQHGFSLVEVIISITLITMVILAFNQLAIFSFRNWENAENRTVAYNLIQSRIEELHNLRDGNISNADPAVIWYSNIVSATTSTPVGGKTYTITTAISPLTVSFTSNDSKRKVVVTVTWTERSGPKSLSSTTYLTDWKGKY